MTPRPLQLAAADALLNQEPLGSSRLFNEVDPRAESVMTTHWLQAADVTAEVAEVVAEADNIEAFAVRTPSHCSTRVRIHAGLSRA